MSIRYKLTRNEKRTYKAMIKLFLENTKKFEKAGITKIQFKSDAESILITIALDKPGFVIGEKGATVKALVQFLHTTGESRIIRINVIQSKLWL